MLSIFQMVVALINFMSVLGRLVLNSTGGGTLHYRQHHEMSHTHTLVVAVHLRLAARLETWLDSSLLCLSTPHMLWTRGENTLQVSGVQNPTWNLQLSLGFNVLLSRLLRWSFYQRGSVHILQKLSEKKHPKPEYSDLWNHFLENLFIAGSVSARKLG